MLSQTAEYALRAVVALAASDEAPHTNEELAKRTKVPKTYLAKVLMALVRAGVLHSRRGINGGFSLAVVADRLTILDVVNAVDPIQRIRRCPLGLKGHTSLCPLHRRLDDAAASIEEAFRATTIAEVLEGGDPIIPLQDSKSGESGA